MDICKIHFPLAPYAIFLWQVCLVCFGSQVHCLDFWSKCRYSKYKDLWIWQGTWECFKIHECLPESSKPSAEIQLCQTLKPSRLVQEFKLGWIGQSTDLGQQRTCSFSSFKLLVMDPVVFCKHRQVCGWLSPSLSLLFSIVTFHLLWRILLWDSHLESEIYA